MEPLFEPIESNEPSDHSELSADVASRCGIRSVSRPRCALNRGPERAPRMMSHASTATAMTPTIANHLSRAELRPAASPTVVTTAVTTIGRPPRPGRQCPSQHPSPPPGCPTAPRASHPAWAMSRPTDFDHYRGSFRRLAGLPPRSARGPRSAPGPARAVLPVLVSASPVQGSGAPPPVAPRSVVSRGCGPSRPGCGNPP